LKDCWWTGDFERCFGSRSGEVDADFFSSHPVVAEAAEFHRDEALVLVDLTEVESDAGEELPEEVVEYSEGLSGRIDDTEIQSCSIGSLLHPFQSEVDFNSLRGA
jgi:hypothetical protein